VLPRRLTELLGDEPARVRNGLAPVWDALAAAPHPSAVLRWLNAGGQSLQGLARIAGGGERVSHDAVYELADLDPRAASHLESLLVATGALPARDLFLAATERWCDRFLADLRHPEHAQLLRTFVRWQWLRPLRERSRQAPLTESSGGGCRARTRIIAEFGDWLVSRDRSFAACRQMDIDDWFANESRHRAMTVGTFARWAMSRKAMPRLELPLGTCRRPAAPVELDERWLVARRLLHAPGISAPDRVAGALVVIYAQPLHRISRLRLEDVTEEADHIAVRFGSSAVAFPEPLAGHLRELLAGRDAKTRKARTISDPGWLFPGGDPGRHIGQETLSNRLRRRGVRPGAHRLAVLYRLAAEMPPAIVADLLGISIRTASMWAHIAGRTWAEYPEMRAHEGTTT
jgi:hypothetical protein